MEFAAIADQISEYDDKWIAISEAERKVVASGENAIETIERAQALGYNETVLCKVPSLSHGFASEA